MGLTDGTNVIAWIENSQFTKQSVHRGEHIQWKGRKYAVLNDVSISLFRMHHPTNFSKEMTTIELAGQILKSAVMRMTQPNCKKYFFCLDIAGLVPSRKRYEQLKRLAAKAASGEKPYQKGCDLQHDGIRLPNGSVEKIQVLRLAITGYLRFQIMDYVVRHLHTLMSSFRLADDQEIYFDYRQEGPAVYSKGQLHDLPHRAHCCGEYDLMSVCWLPGLTADAKLDVVFETTDTDLIPVIVSAIESCSLLLANSDCKIYWQSYHLKELEAKPEKPKKESKKKSSTKGKGKKGKEKGGEENVEMEPVEEKKQKKEIKATKTTTMGPPPPGKRGVDTGFIDLRQLHEGVIKYMTSDEEGETPQLAKFNKPQWRAVEQNAIRTWVMACILSGTDYVRKNMTSYYVPFWRAKDNKHVLAIAKRFQDRMPYVYRTFEQFNAKGDEMFYQHFLTRVWQPSDSKTGLKQTQLQPTTPTTTTKGSAKPLSVSNRFPAQNAERILGDFVAQVRALTTRSYAKDQASRKEREASKAGGGSSGDSENADMETEEKKDEEESKKPSGTKRKAPASISTDDEEDEEMIANLSLLDEVEAQHQPKRSKVDGKSEEKKKEQPVAKSVNKSQKGTASGFQLLSADLDDEDDVKEDRSRIEKQASAALASELQTETEIVDALLWNHAYWTPDIGYLAPRMPVW